MFPLCACLKPLSALFAVLESHCYISGAAVRPSQLTLDARLLGLILFMTETLAQHPKAGYTGQISPALEQIAGLKVNQGPAAAASLLTTTLSLSQQQLATAARSVKAEGDTHSSAPAKSVGLTCLSPEDIEAVTVRALATLQWLNGQACTRQPSAEKHFEAQMVIIVLLHKLLSDHVRDAQQYLQTVFVHGLAPLMECWQIYGTRMPELNDLCMAVLWQMIASMPRPADCEEDTKLQLSGIFALWQCFSEYLCCVCWVIVVALILKSCMFCGQGCISKVISCCWCFQAALDVHLASCPVQLLLNNRICLHAACTFSICQVIPVHNIPGYSSLQASPVSILLSWIMLWTYSRH